MKINSGMSPWQRPLENISLHWKEMVTQLVAGQESSSPAAPSRFSHVAATNGQLMAYLAHPSHGVAAEKCLDATDFSVLIF